jgi:hypothetical protein
VEKMDTGNEENAMAFGLQWSRGGFSAGRLVDWLEDVAAIGPSM